MSENKIDKEACPFGAYRGGRQKVNIIHVLGEGKMRQEKGTGWVRRGRDGWIPEPESDGLTDGVRWGAGVHGPISRTFFVFQLRSSNSLVLPGQGHLGPNKHGDLSIALQKPIHPKQRIIRHHVLNCELPFRLVSCFGVRTWVCDCPCAQLATY